MRVVTGWGPAGWGQYGRRFVETFERYWPPEVELVAYVEEIPRDWPGGRTQLVQLNAIPGCPEFLRRHANRPRSRGREPNATWKPRAQQMGYNWRFDAWKFCRQGFIPLHAALQAGTGLLCWLDGDVVTHAPVPTGFLERLIPAGAAVSYLGRGQKHSEIGFQLYRLPDAVPMLREFSALYDTDRIFAEREWHSAYAFDLARARSGVPAHDLTPGGMGHVWHQSPLRFYTDHLKGGRKGLPASPERRTA